ncbi:STAS/SEC14 domain-containing protein [Colwellia sp. 4_MG-2023]|uniref:STAS/SEC14 domain-containing protein n=1 Tax=unclassified Colwellia TaxID=196834 RepID=UPI0026E41498|nr:MULTISPECIES: STAS/SEC14 domain-containing protein [unclassified Colwellia]MDO6507739.1 STAS/SEC14 domain-containing protein [Colwellia sp. 5_MG-2023]MDO6556341.1 STAS/SEC14 domain-containing protein [Colwellia sp. 4_MG-2023]
MHSKRHGLSIGMERAENDFFIFIKAQGKLTHQDYEIITPFIESMLTQVRTPTVNVLFDGTELDGWELRAAWDDLKLGLKHGTSFNKVALYGNKKWQAFSVKVADWFMSGEIKYFEKENDAIAWLNQ